MTSPAQPSYSLRQGNADDAINIAAALKKGYANDVLVRNLNGQIDPEELRLRAEQRALNVFAQSHLTGQRYELAIDNTSQEIVGVAAFNLPICLDAAQKAERQAFLDAQKAKPPAKGANPALEAALAAQGADCMAKFCDREKDVFVATLAVVPEHTRRGVASMLVDKIIGYATDLDANLYLIATPMGVPMYLRRGLVVVDEIQIDFGKYGSPEDGVGSASCMLWKNPSRTLT